jgi:5-methylcytosine-specific restriction protein B
VESVRRIMTDEWGWSPRDLWDVQGFVWAVNRADKLPQGEDVKEIGSMPPYRPPTNLIFYGPPGTGKTYATAEQAVLLCNGSVPQDRREIMGLYASLVSSGRIEFVTFHQSYSYEDFVEGLRPVQAENASNGFSLEPRMGAFRRIARRAETSTGPGFASFKIGDRRVFKMSIGEAANPDEAHLFEDALANGYTLLGFEDIDWSDSRFERREAIIEACKQNSADDYEKLNAQSGKVQCPFLFRNAVRNDDIIVVSKGNGLFRAIGVVAGDYEYVRREANHYSHRRKVDWFWRDLAGIPVGEIYSKNFSQRSIYELDKSELNIAALERYISSQESRGSGGTPEQFVLIVDEINRANISKVFGELITLIEPDKRIGAPNELRIQLPYSQDIMGVPPNLHIIGTMNTADRSIALLDTALRRRFEFRELMPDAEKLSNASAATGVNLVKMLSIMNDRIEYLFDREHQIGHAYLIGCSSRADVDAVVRHKIIPLLAEYFYEDWSKVASILGDAEGGSLFLERIRLLPPSGLALDEDGDPRFRWKVKPVFDNACYDQFQ